MCRMVNGFGWVAACLDASGLLNTFRSSGQQTPCFCFFDMGCFCSWHVAESTSLPIHGQYSSFEMLLTGRPHPFADSGLLFSALDASGCQGREATSGPLQYDLLKCPEGSRVLAPWLEHLQKFATQIFRAAVLPVEQQQQKVADVGLWLHEQDFP